MTTSMAHTMSGTSSKLAAPAAGSSQKSSLTARLNKELMSIMMSPDLGKAGVSAFPKGDSLLEWAGTLRGPEGTVYAGLVYRISIAYGPEYPFQAPTVRFETPIWHPNTTLTGDICLDILKEEWSPSLSTATILLSLQSLLGEPNNRSPLNVEAADMWDDQAATKVEVLRHYKPIDV